MAQQNQQQSNSQNSLQGKTPAETYKDLLTVASATNNQGLEPTAKRVFDGEGVGSPLFLGTNSLDIVGETSISGTTSITGNTTITGDLTVTGDIINDGMMGDGVFDGAVTATAYNMVNNSTGNTTTAFALADDGTVQVTANLVTKGAMTFMGAGGEEVRVDAASGGLTKGDGTKGKVMMKDNEVALNKGDKELFVAKEDGTTRMQSVDTLPENPQGGDMINKGGEIFIATGDESR